jgi:hypothetical protein
MSDMRRRQFITLLGGAAVMWQTTAHSPRSTMYDAAGAMK